jgi:alanine dehydrogenase
VRSLSLIPNSEVERLLGLPLAIECVGAAFREHGSGSAINQPRSRAVGEHSVLAITGPAALAGIGRMGFKAFSVAPPPSHTAGRAVSAVALYDAVGGHLLALVEADSLSRIRTAAATAVATDVLSRRDARHLTVVGTGALAFDQVAAISHVRPLSAVTIVGRKLESAERLAKDVRTRLDVDADADTNIETAVINSDIIVTTTSAEEPILSADVIPDGAHINAIGGNYASRRELTTDAVKRASVVVVDDVPNAVVECGDIIAAVSEGLMEWEDVIELGALIAGTAMGRRTDADITLFESQGIGILDVAAASAVYDRC